MASRDAPLLDCASVVVGERRMENPGTMEQGPDEGSGAQQPDVVALILRHLAEPKDVLAAAAVCRCASISKLDEMPSGRVS